MLTYSSSSYDLDILFFIILYTKFNFRILFLTFLQLVLFEIVKKSIWLLIFKSQDFHKPHFFCCACRWEGLLWQNFKKDFSVYPQWMFSEKIKRIINKIKSRTKIRTNFRCNFASLKTLKKLSKCLYIYNQK